MHFRHGKMEFEVSFHGMRSKSELNPAEYTYFAHNFGRYIEQRRKLLAPSDCADEMWQSPSDNYAISIAVTSIMKQL